MFKIDRIYRSRVKYIFIGIVILIGMYFIFSKHPFAHYAFAYFYPYHNQGEILLTIDGQKTDVNDIAISFYSDSYFFMPDNPNAKYESSLIKKNKFKFKKGSYGGNVFVFSLPNDHYNILPNSDIILEFGHFNTNNWHVLKYNIEVNIEKIEDGAIVTMKQKNYFVTDNNKNSTEGYIISTTINDEQNIVACYYGS